MTTEINNIIEKIKLGMKRAYIDTLNFTGNPAQKFGAEYLFTVNVAKAIGELNVPHGDPYKIYIEEKTKDVAKNCLPILKFDKGDDFLKKRNTTFRSNHSLPAIERNGRIDIAVYKEDKNRYIPEHVPFCIIELKSFNPNRKLVVKDLKRNIELLRASGPTGVSSIQAGIFSAAHQIMNFDTDNQIASEVKGIILNYEKWYSDIGNISDLNILTKNFSLSREMEGEVTHEIDGSYVDTSTRHCFIGIIVIITLNNNILQLE
ncbi:hypothetical protein PSC74_10995 [Aeromonas hydrophila]|uniref:hypothetical protein n=1 Tax=Aeromonas hydrophila TaxID=644 RepID=UPI0023620B93|nr:hypothetical protein [Aeromonas hydrophila]WDA26805.1 hypothetical protein PSC74_10995 [Aeromonas hydrophila]WES92678.1 hypothetical protein PY368_19685 [Aeromonas hydrophila]